MIRQRDKKRACEESLLMKIPVLGYFFRNIQEYREPIETTLKTGKAVDREIEKSSFLGGLITIVSGKSFDTLKLRRRK
ncbi:MAG: hypothetical protein AABX27_04450 [Nanoarchaeota archaeon]